MDHLNWESSGTHVSKSYRCGFCGHNLASQRAYRALDPTGRPTAFIYICHYCTAPTFFDPADNQTPGFAVGESVDHVSDNGVAVMYDEARKAFASGAHSAAVLCCRKLLMHIAVSKGAAEGGTFVSYVEYLADKHYVPPDAREWVDQIRKSGNEANHEIRLSTPEEAEELISFSQMLLKVIFEFPGTVKKRSVAPSAKST